jgi:hypothetical protein
MHFWRAKCKRLCVYRLLPSEGRRDDRKIKGSVKSGRITDRSKTGARSKGCPVR